MMTRTQRLLKLLQILRGYRHPVTGECLAEQLNVSIRTLYRDIATLQAQGAEIEGAAGIGYVLKPSFFLPPLMLSEIEVQALLLGGQWVSQYGDAPLSKAAKVALDKIADVLPSQVKKGMNAFSLRVGPPATETMRNEDLSVMRQAIAGQNKILMVYKGEAERIVWPFTIGYFTHERILVAFNEGENNFTHYETKQIVSIKVLSERYPRSKDALFREWQNMQLSSIHK